MKKLLSTLFALILIISVSKAQVSTSFQIGSDLSKMTVGYDITPKFNAFLGFSYMKASLEASDGTNKTELDANAFIPNIGIKYFFYNKNMLRTNLNLSYYKPFINANSNEDEIDIDIENALDDTKFYGFEIGLGVEYFIADQFSIGSDFGFRLAGVNSDIEELELKANIGYTYTNFSLNYHF